VHRYDRSHPRHRRLPLAFVLAGLLLLAQALGLAHRVVHGGAMAVVAQASWSAGHEAGGAVCQLVDQLAHADALCTGAAADVAQAPPAQAPATALPGLRVARTPPAYLARGPPAA